MGKAVAVIYAFIGVPLMLVLLSALGSLLASGARKGYSKFCCLSHRKATKSPSVGYHKAPSSPSNKRYCKNHDDLASIQLMPTAALHAHTNNHHHCVKSTPLMDHQEMPKRAILATVRAPRTRGGRCRQGTVRQTLMDAPPIICPAHPQKPIKNHATLNSSIVGIATTADLDDPDDTDDNEHSHDTPSRIPLIWRPPDANSTGSRSPVHQQSTPSVPGLLVLLLFVCYVCAGAATFSSIHSSWSFLDALYYCFVALSTISPGERLPSGPSPTAQAQLLAWAAYLFVGLAVVAMCFSLVHEEVVHRCRQVTRWMGLNTQEHR
ncbi:unnamed protein product [Acanthoscelides obtectus]|uniref:Potassium channel domain-containing protein n=1 Tax=Acanthoscelides obtectus TaxID=200917 RepID=A0A9P0JVM2_ACAOB|nr:unnamed protein product [Acanthoscelides obtectus]CAK1661915.1 Two pore potassium channel a [Acanthoscelides obtectus]